MDQKNISNSTNPSCSKATRRTNVSSSNEKSQLVPNWILEIFEWIKRTELIHSPMNTASRIFHRICWLKLHGSPRRLPHLLISCEAGADLKQPQRAKMMKQIIAKFGLTTWNPIPICSIRPPDYFTGIRSINIKFLNGQIFEFLKSVVHFLENCYLVFYNDFLINGCENEEQRNKLLCEFLAIMASKICIFELPFYTTSFFCRFFRLHPHILNMVQGFYVNAFEFDDSIFIDWVTKPHCGGKQKILFLKLNIPDRMMGLIIRIKKEFRTSTRQANFFISAYDCAKFRIENERIGEILEIYKKSKNSADRYLVRYPKDEEEYWKRNGQNKIEKMTCRSRLNQWHIKMDIAIF